MNKFIIEGGHKLYGSITVPTAKNSILPIMAGCLLSKEKIVIHKCPKYSDIDNMINILKHLGATVELKNDDLIIQAKRIQKTIIPKELSDKLRSSIFTLGPILARKGNATIYNPGGCTIGSRPIDLHLFGLKKMGAKIIEKPEYCECKSKKLKGCEITLSFPSVGATENLIMAGVLADGVTRINNPAKEPEIVDLANFLNSIGAKIYGTGTDVIVIEGVDKLSGGEYTPISDRIIAGTYLLTTLACKGEVEICNTNPEHIQDLLKKLENNTCNITTKSDRIIVQCNDRLKSISDVETKPYPLFPTDLQPQLMTALCLAKGTSSITENIFETRFKHVDYLNSMGAKILIQDNMAIIKGRSYLVGKEVESKDLRGGASLVIAGLVAKGTTIVSGVNFIDRGYENLEESLTKLGAKIKRI